MQNIVILIIEKNFLIRKGLNCLIKEIDSQINIINTTTENQIQNLLLENRPDYILINSEFLNSSKLLSFIKNYNIICIGNESYSISNEITVIEHINSNESEEIIKEKILQIFSKHIFAKDSEKNDELSIREMEIVKFVALGCTNQEIADKLFLSPHTVITHRKNITKKLGIKTVSGLTVFAILNNIISIDSVKQ